LRKRPGLRYPDQLPGRWQAIYLVARWRRVGHVRPRLMHVLTLAFLLALGDGKAIFEGKGGCLNCHSIENRGGSLGPDLSEIGIRRTPESLRLALTDPSAEIFEEYFTVVATTKRGQRIEGVALNE